MATAPLLSDDLLDPISPDQPAGANLRWTPEWDRIKEARRADDGFEAGRWAKKERKSADWLQVEELASSMLRKRSKDLQLAMWLTEASLKLHGFPGLRDGLRLTRELIVRYWDLGLYPPMEDGPEDRAGPLEWLNEKLVDSIILVPITARSDHGQNYAFRDLQDARLVGSEASWRSPDGEDSQKKKKYEQALAEGHISLEMFRLAVEKTERIAYDQLNSDFEQAYMEFKALDRVIDDKFGDAAPNLSKCRTTLSEIREDILDILSKKPQPTSPTAPPQSSPENLPERTDHVTLRFPLSGLNQPAPPTARQGSWHDAEALIRSGQVDEGLAEMTRLAASETSGRNRFQRKLVLAEVCLASKRERLARAILEELADQIDKFQLEAWETSDLIGSVWTRLYRLYKQEGTGDAERAAKLYERLCRLDPWQALTCGE